MTLLGSCWHLWNSEGEVPALCRNIFTCSYCFAAFTNIQTHLKVICVIYFLFNSPNFIPYLLATLMKYPAHRHLLSISVLEPSKVSLGKSGSWGKKKQHQSGSFLQEKAGKHPPSHGFKTLGFFLYRNHEERRKTLLLAHFHHCTWVTRVLYKNI